MENNDGDFPDWLLHNQRLIFMYIIPGICIPIALIGLIANGLLFVAHIKIRCWRMPAKMSFLNVICLDIITSVAMIIFYSIKIKMGVDPNWNDLVWLLNDSFNWEQFAVFASLFATLVMVSLRLFALSSPFMFREFAKLKYIVTLNILSWVVGGTAFYIDKEYYLEDQFYILWIVYLVLALVAVLIALATLFPLHGTGISTAITSKATRSIVILAVVHFTCYGSYAAASLAEVLLCGRGDMPIWVLRLVCNPETFMSVKLILPTMNSIINAVIVSRSDVICEEMRTWVTAISSPPSINSEYGQNIHGPRHDFRTATSLTNVTSY